MSPYMRDLRARVGPTLLEVPSVSILTFDDANRVLLVKNADVARWTTPGGAVEPEEVPADAAVREMWEEAGLHVELTRVLGVYGGPEFVVNYSNGDATSYLIVVFEGRILGGEPRPDGVETLEVGWFSEAELGGIPLCLGASIVLAEAFRSRNQPHFAAATWRPPSGS